MPKAESDGPLRTASLESGPAVSDSARASGRQQAGKAAGKHQPKIPKLPMVRVETQWYRARLLKCSAARVLIGECNFFTFRRACMSCRKRLYSLTCKSVQTDCFPYLERPQICSSQARCTQPATVYAVSCQPSIVFSFMRRPAPAGYRILCICRNCILSCAAVLAPSAAAEGHCLRITLCMPVRTEL